MEAKKFIISLPNGKSIKYRVTDSSDDWILIEAIIDKELLNFLNNFAVDLPVQETTTQTIQSDSETNSPVSVTQSDTSVSQKNKPPLTQEQENILTDIKMKMKIETNEELNLHIQDWSFGQGKTYDYLDKNNVNDFIQHMRDNILNQ